MNLPQYDIRNHQFNSNQKIITDKYISEIVYKPYGWTEDESNVLVEMK